MEREDTRSAPAAAYNARMTADPMSPAPDSRTAIPLLHDVGLAVVLTTFLVAQVAFGSRLLGAFGFPVPVLSAAEYGTALVLATGSSLPLLARRRAPIAVFAAVTAAATAYQMLGLPSIAVTLGPTVAVYTLALLRGRRPALLAAAVGAVALSLPLSPALTPLGWVVDVVRTLLLLGAAAAFGDGKRSRVERMRESELRAAEAERTRASEAARAVDEERLRIARELHDITAHSVSVVSLQTEYAKRVLDIDQAAARVALDVIGTTSRQALSELRGMLTGLRTGERELAPAPSLVRAGELVGRLRDAGIEVDAELAIDAPGLPPFVDASAYRILQEAVTNVIRHAGAGHVTLRVCHEDDAVSLHVEDDGPGTGLEGTAGHGIIGMRERAAALGGTFEARPKPGGGFLVEARLPVANQGVVRE